MIASPDTQVATLVAGDCPLDTLPLALVLLLVSMVPTTVGVARVRALARASKTTPRPWVYEAGAREGLEI